MHEERTRPASAAAEAPAGEERLTYTLNEAARRLGISRALAYEAAQRGRAAGVLPGLRPPAHPGPAVQPRLVENTLGRCADCGHQATKLLVGGAGQPDTSLCAACEYRRYLAATGGRDLANQERARWASHPSHALTLLVPALRPVTMVNSDR